MATSTRRRSSSPTADRAKHAVATGSKQLVKDWLTLTFATDRQRLVGPITPTILNWIMMAAVAVLGRFGIVPLGYLIIVVAAWVFATALRANHVQRRRRKTMTRIFEAVAPQAKLPAGPPSNPTNPATYIRKVKWGSGSRPTQFTLTVSASAPAATTPLLRGPLEADIENLPHPLQGQGGEWLFEWNGANVTATAVPADDPRLSQKTYTRRIAALIQQIFKLTGAGVQGWAVDVEDWQQAPTADGGAANYPTRIRIRCANKDLTDPVMRDSVERHFERAIPTPGEWLFDWNPTASLVEIASVDASDLNAERKRIQRRLGDDMKWLVARPGKDPIIVEVTEWIGSDAPLPRTVHATFGTLSFDDPRKIDSIEDGFDSAVQTLWPQARALFEWHHGATTELDITLVASDDPEALRRTALTRFRNVTQSKFGSAKNAVITEVIEWQNELSPSGIALPNVARVHFGTVDVTKPDTRDAFQDHWDSIDSSNDWHYSWNTPEGFVEMRAVPKLPDAIVFPEEGSEQNRLFHDLFRRGKIVIGLKKGGGLFLWDLNSVAHGLVGGSTGAGKSVLLDMILQLILVNRDIAEVVGIDIKMTDFPWMKEFPNVITFAETPEQACAAIAETKAEMNRRRRLLNKRGVKTLGRLRALYAEHPEMEAEDGPCPKRRFLFFDEIGEFLAESKDKDLEELLSVARADLESIGRLARAMEINMVTAAQKPEAKVVSTQLKLMMQFKICVGPVDEYTSKQILESNHGTRFPPTAPKGRAWAWTSAEGFHLVQVPFLPSETESAPWDPSITVQGSADRLRAGLVADGWALMHRPNDDGGSDPYWLRVEDEPAQGSSTELPVSFEKTMPEGLPDDAGDAYLDDSVDTTDPDDDIEEIPVDPDDLPWS